MRYKKRSNINRLNKVKTPKFEDSKRPRKERVIDLSKYNIGFSNVEQNVQNTKNKPQKNKYDQYGRYLKKLEDGDLEKFSTRDIMFHFRDVANRNGVKYVIGNAKIDMRNFKTALERGYTNEQILAMIEFLFESDQDYLDKTTLHPGILLTGWCNTIFQDSQLWLDDLYVPRSERNKTKNSKRDVKREWVDNNPSTDCTIGEWDI